MIAPRAGLRPARPPRGMRPAAPSCPAAAWTEPNPSSLQAARWTRKLGAALRFSESDKPAHLSIMARLASSGGQKTHAGGRGAERLNFEEHLDIEARCRTSLVGSFISRSNIVHRNNHENLQRQTGRSRA
ncbi:hypothetical protein THICB330018 [Thiomonas sp. CB3]|nr:hypothetical protein THICB330018 [Thiomonas sp. CB3]